MPRNINIILHKSKQTDVHQLTRNNCNLTISNLLLISSQTRGQTIIHLISYRARRRQNLIRIKKKKLQRKSYYPHIHYYAIIKVQ